MVIDNKKYQIKAICFFSSTVFREMILLVIDTSTKIVQSQKKQLRKLKWRQEIYYGGAANGVGFSTCNETIGAR